MAMLERSMEEEIQKEIVRLMPETKEELLTGVLPVVRNRKAVGEFLDKCPYDELADLIVLYRITLQDIEHGGTIGALITHGNLEKYGLTVEEMREAAQANLEEEITVRNLWEHLQEIRDEHETEDLPDFPESIAEDFPIFILTTKKGKNGAGALCHTDTFRSLAYRLGGKITIIPASIHEILIHRPLKNADRLRDMIRFVNENECYEWERLSDHPYSFDLASGKVMSMNEGDKNE